jgi:tetratricopeptide (TPR) repeat protein
MQVYLRFGEPRIEDARKIADRFDKADPDDKSGFADTVAIERASILYNDADVAGALKALEAVADKYPKTDEAGRLWYLIGALRHANGDHEGAEAGWKKSAELDPTGDWGKRAAEDLKGHHH